MIYQDIINYGKGWNNVSDRTKMQIQNLYRGEVSRVQVGETVVKGDLLYPVLSELGTVAHWKKTNAANANLSPALAVALEGGSSGGRVKVLHRGYVKDRAVNYGTQATGTVTVSGTVVEGDKVVLGPVDKPVCLMFTAEVGTSSKAKTKAKATLTTTGVPVVGEKHTIDTTVFEVTQGGALTVGSHYAINCAAGLSQSVFNTAIDAALDQAIADRVLDISYSRTTHAVEITLGGAWDSYKGLEQNAVATTENHANASWGAATFVGGCPAVNIEMAGTLTIAAAKILFVAGFDKAVDEFGLDMSRANDWATNDMVLTAGTKFHKGYKGNNLRMYECNLAGTKDGGANLAVSGDNFTGGEEGGVLYVDTNAGKLSRTEPEYAVTQVVGYAMEADKFFFNPSPAQNKAIMGNELAASYGAGAIATNRPPRKFRRVIDGVIVTEYWLYLAGLGCAGNDAGDVIGIVTQAPDAYFDRYKVAEHGILFRAELMCIVLPGEGTATITRYIQIRSDAAADKGYDDAASAIIVSPGKAVEAGCSYVNREVKAAANHYLYLAEGDTAASTGVYDAGQLVVRLFGKPTLP